MAERRAGGDSRQAKLGKGTDGGGRSPARGAASAIPVAPTLSLPKGGGAIRGIDEKFTTNPATGTASFTIPIATSQGRSGSGPELGLHYDSGTGHGVFGTGWRVSVPAVTRKTDKGLPQYIDGEESDVFVLSSAEDLVPLRGEDIVREGHRIRRYRPRVEGLFARIERWTSDASGDSHFRIVSRDNLESVYGRTAQARIADPAAPGRVFSWLLEETRDDRGNVVRYTYKAEDGAGVDPTRTSEVRRFEHVPGAAPRLLATAQRYLKRIQYGNRVPIARGEPAPSDPAAWLFETVFDYGEHAAAAPAPDDDLTAPWSPRADPVSTYRAGFEIRTYRLCRRVLMFHRFAELGEAPCLVRSTDFVYDESPTITYLTQVEHAGYTRRPDGSYHRAALPALELDYARLTALDDTLQTLDRTALDGIPDGIGGGSTQWIDLDGEGIPGVLRPGERGWYYKANRGDGQLGPATLLRSLPVPAELSTGAQQFVDLQGDGRLELVSYTQPLAGYFTRTADDGWEPFRPLRALPVIDWGDPNLRTLDLDGDGLSDVLITEHDALVWYRSLGEAGFEPARRITRVLDEDSGPALVFADVTESIYLADMTGDGLVDIVRVRNGDVSYWPNLGYGRFGRKVTMDGSPAFDRGDRFDPRRVRFADVDGSGTSDVLYLGRDGVAIYLNQSGNALAAPQVIRSLPVVDTLAGTTVVDLRGRGTACLVWSSPAPASASHPVVYVDLMNGIKPHLLVSIKNNLGAETRIAYASSSEFYLADKAAGTPWITRLPFPVHVVARVTTYDRISRNRFVTRYTYHHGYFDGVEREFRGFGRVDQLDTEEIGALTASGEFPAGDNLDAASYVPPVLTRTWFHTGVFADRARISTQLAHEYHAEPGLGVEQQRAMRLDDTALPPGLAADDLREACRALKGATLRREVYALDGTPAQDRPYLVAEHNYTVVAIEPRGGQRYGVFFVHPREAVELHHERMLYDVAGGQLADPRVSHAVTLDVDAFGNVLRSAMIGYGRRHPGADPVLTEADRAEQRRIWITCTEHAYTEAIDQDAAYRTPLPCERRSYEITKLAPRADIPDVTNRFGFDELRQAIDGLADGRHDLPYEDLDGAGASEPHPYRRTVEHTRTLYRRDDLAGPLPLGRSEPRALAYESYQLALTPGLVTAVYGDRITDAMLAGDAGYVHSEGDAGWWIPSGRVLYSPGAADSAAQELAYARQHFFLPCRFVDPFGHATQVSYDAYDLLTLQTRDALDNLITIGARDATGAIIDNGNDYRVLQAARVMDPNRNRRAVAFDALGMVVGTAVMGKPEQTLGDSLDGFAADLPPGTVAAQLADPLADPHSLLQRATSRLVYDLFAYQRTQADPQPAAPVVYTLVRETHDADLAPGQRTRIQHSFSYSDGFGRELQNKAQAEPGPLVPGGPVLDPRWVGSGWTIFNNKGKPVRQYEPFFTGSHRFESAKIHGVSSVMFYDPAERVVATLHPDHTYDKVVFDPWQQASWDVNDTVLVSDPRTDPDVGAFFARLPEAEYLPTWYDRRRTGALGAAEKAAADKTAVHAETPAVVHFDALGRPFLSVAHNRFERAGIVVEEAYRTKLIMDIAGNQRSIVDARERIAVRYDHDVNGDRVHQVSMEAGERWILNDVAMQVCHVWDSRGQHFRTTYDELRRPKDSISSEHTGRQNVIERSVYGESQADPERGNLRNQLIQQFDQAGVITREQYDFKGNCLKSSRRLVRAIDEAGRLRPEYKATIDWSSDVVLETENHVEHARYDALDRPIQMVAPHSATAGAGIHVTQFEYNSTSLLERLDVWLDRNTVPEGLLDAARVPSSLVGISNIGYDPKGQRLRVDYKNGVATHYRYDPNTYRIVLIYTRRSAGFTEDCDNPAPPPATSAAPDEPPSTASCGVQHLQYTYDPVGNVTGVRDLAQQTIYFRNARVDPDAEYTYDATYRLIAATGREHLGQVGGSPVPSSYNDIPRVALPHPNDGNAMGRYVERYVYDSTGNILSLQHRGASPLQPGWTRAFVYDEASQIEATRRSNRLSSTTVGGGQDATTETYSTSGDGYDSHGNMLRMPQLQVMVWNEHDQLRMSQRQAVSQTDIDGMQRQGERTWYAYDARGQRNRKVTELANGQVKEERIYLDGVEIYRRYGVNPLVRQTLHVTDGDRRVALVETRTQGSDASPPRLVRYQMGNHLDSVSLELDEQARIISYEEYTPFGSTSYQAVASQTQAPKRYRIASKERDEETGLAYHTGRYCAPWLGRWISSDPALNIYRTNSNGMSRMSRNSTSSGASSASAEGGARHRGEGSTSADPTESDGAGASSRERDEASIQDIAAQLNGYCYVLNNPIVYQDPDGLAPVPIGHVYVVRGTLGGQAVTYTGSTAQELLERVGKHRWRSLITSKSTTVTTYEVSAELDIAASGRATLLSARTEALRSAEQKILSQIQKEEAIALNEVRAARPENVAKWWNRHGVQIGGAKLTLRGGVRLGAFSGLAILQVFDLYRQEKLSRYEYAPYVLEDSGGVFTLSEERAHWFAHHYHWKVYQTGPNAGQKVEIEEGEFDFWKREGELLWGTTDFWGDFVPGLLRPTLPIVSGRIMDEA